MADDMVAADDMVDTPDEPAWERVRELFEQALILDESARTAFVREAAADDASLCTLVLGMLEEDRRTLLEDSVKKVVGRLVELPEPETLLAAGRRVGAYQIVREIGRGGMGVVYLATRTNPEMSVALKVVRGLLAAPENLERFVREQQALARLEHPGIARFIDAGTLDDDTPFYAMEFVEGEEITGYCDRLSLGIDDRLRLFAQVCDAVDHAHRALVVHRDIKPSNVLVDASGRPRLVDFGIAKMIDSDTGGIAQITQGMAPLTPAFAAPEQLAGEPITVATDVYGLGHLLFVLLTGSHPPGAEAVTRPSRVVDDSSADAAQRRGTTVSGLRRKLRGDLDNIAMKALAEDRSMRYLSAAALLEDIERHLAARPVAARPPTLTYRANRFMRRNRLIVALSAILAFALVGAGVLLAIEQQRTAAERDRARLEATRAEQVGDFLADLFRASDPTAGLGADTPVREFLERGTEQVGDLGVDPAVRASLLAVLSRVWANLANYPQSEVLWRQVIDLHETSQGVAAHERVDAMMGLADARSRQEDPQEAVALYEGAFQILEKAPSTDANLASRGRLLTYLAANQFRESRFHDAEATYLEAAQILRSVRPLDHRMLASAEVGIANSANAMGRSDDADAANQRAIEHLSQAGPAGRAGLATVLNNLSNTRALVGDYEAAIDLMRRSLALKRDVYSPGHPTIGVSLTNLANVLSSAHRPGEALELLDEAIQIQQNALGEQHRYYLNAINAKGIALLEAGQAEAAERLYESAVTRLGTEVPAQDRRFFRLLPKWAESLSIQGRHAAAEDVLRRLLDVGLATMAPDEYRLARIRAQLATNLIDQGRRDEAEPLLRLAEQHLQRPAFKDELAEVRSQLESIGQGTRPESGRE